MLSQELEELSGLRPYGFLNILQQNRFRDRFIFD